MLIALTAAAPPFSAADASAAGSGVFGVIFAITGTLTSLTTARTISSTSAGSLPTSVPYPSACGQLRLSSIATMPVSAIRAESRANSSAFPPNTEPITVAPAARARAISLGYSSIAGIRKAHGVEETPLRVGLDGRIRIPGAGLATDRLCDHSARTGGPRTGEGLPALAPDPRSEEKRIAEREGSHLDREFGHGRSPRVVPLNRLGRVRPRDAPRSAH